MIAKRIVLTCLVAAHSWCGGGGDLVGDAGGDQDVDNETAAEVNAVSQAYLMHTMP